MATLVHKVDNYKPNKDNSSKIAIERAKSKDDGSEGLLLARILASKSRSPGNVHQRMKNISAEAYVHLQRLVCQETIMYTWLIHQWMQTITCKAGLPGYDNRRMTHTSARNMTHALAQADDYLQRFACCRELKSVIRVPCIPRLLYHSQRAQPVWGLWTVTLVSKVNRISIACFNPKKYISKSKNEWFLGSTYWNIGFIFITESEKRAFIYKQRHEWTYII